MKKEYSKPKAIVVSIESSCILANSDRLGTGGLGTPGTNGQARKFYRDWEDEEDDY